VPQNLVTTGNQAFTASSVSEGVMLQNGASIMTVAAGSSGTTINGHTVDVPAFNGDIIVDGSSLTTLAPIPVTNTAVTGSYMIITIGGETFTASPESTGVVLQNSGSSLFLPAGTAATTINGQVISAGDLTPSDSASKPNSVVTASDMTIFGTLVLGMTNAVEVGGRSLSVGGPIAVISAQTLTMGSNDLAIASVANAQPDGVLAAAGATVTASTVPGPSGQVVVGSTTLSVGGSAVVTNGWTISEASGALVMVQSGTTVAFSALPVESNSILTAGDATITASGVPGQPNEVIVDGTTLSVGGSALINDSETISDGSSGLVMIQSGTAVAFNRVPTEGNSVLTAGDVTITASAVSGHPNEVTVDGTTLSVGGSALVTNGRMNSDGTDGLMLLDASTTMLFKSATTPSSTAVVTAPPSGSSAAVDPSRGSTKTTKSAAAYYSYEALLTMVSLAAVFVTVFLM